FDRPHGLGKGRAQPRLDISEQRVGARDPWDEAATRGLTREARVEGADQHRRHGSPDSTPRGVSDEHAVRTTPTTPTVRAGRPYPPDRVGIPRSRSPPSSM